MRHVVFVVDADPVACQMRTKLFNRWLGLRKRNQGPRYAVCIAESPAHPMEPVSVHSSFRLAEQRAKDYTMFYMNDDAKVPA